MGKLADGGDEHCDKASSGTDGACGADDAAADNDAGFRVAGDFGGHKIESGKRHSV